MIKKSKYHYIIEEIDIDGDKNNDGMLISMYKLDKYGDKIFLKNKYVSFKDFYRKHKLLSHKIGGRIKQQDFQNDDEVIVMTKAQYNKFMNQHNHKQRISDNQPSVIINSENPSFMNSVATGFGIGAGAAGGQMAVEGATDFIGSFFE